MGGPTPDRDMATPVLMKRKREEGAEEQEGWEEQEVPVYYGAVGWRSYASFLKEQGIQEAEPQVEETPATHPFSAPLSDMKLAEYERATRNFYARIGARNRANPGSVQMMPGLASSGSSASR